MVAAIASHAATYLGEPIDPGWRAQLDEIGALDAATASRGRIVGRCDDVRSVITVLRHLRWLLTLMPLPRVGPSPGRWGEHAATGTSSRPANDAVVSKVRALLAKAESTDFPAEAETFMAKAQELITRHAIDRALLEPEPPDAPIARRVHIDEPYADAKSMLLTQVASANHCRSVRSAALGFSTVFGYRDDVDTVELLHASLLVQATRAMTAAGRLAAPGERSRSRAFRRAFLLGFACEIGERLRASAARETADGDERAGGSLLPVLARRDEAVHAAVQAAFPVLTKGRTLSLSDGEGWSAGRAAGRTASFHLDPGVAPHLTT